MEETLTGVVGWLVAALSGLATVVVTVVAVVQQRRVQRGVLRLTVGVTCMILGLFAVAMAAVPLYTQDLSPLAGTGVKFAALAAAGVVLSIIGATVVLLAPSIDRHDMQEVLAAVELRIEQSERRDRIDRRHQVDLGVRRMDEPVGRPPRSLSVSTLVAGGVTFLCGGRGSGKTAALRRFALDRCRRSFHRRKPRDLVVYVEVRALESITVGAIRRHLTEGFDDAVVGEKLGKYLDDRTGRHRWLFAFDIGDELTPDQAAKYAAAVGEFLRTRHRDRAVIAMRTPPPNADVVLAVGELTALSSLRLLQRHGITISTHAALLDRLHTDPEFVELRREVALFSGLASYWAAAPFRGESRREVIDGFLASRFDLAGYLGEDLAARVAHAEEAAFRLIFDPNTAVGANNVAAVVVADLGRFEGTTFRFRSPLTQAHLAARYVLRQNPEIDVDALLDDADGRAMLVAALRSPDGAVRDELITRLARRVQDHQLDTARADGLVPGDFRWPLSQLFALTVLRDSLTGRPLVLPVAAQPAVDATIRRAILAGGASARYSGIRMLPLASPDCRTELLWYVVALPANLRRLAVKQAGAYGDFLAGFSGPERLRLMVHVARSGLLTSLVDATRAGGDGTSRMITALGGVARWTAIGMLVFFGIAQVRAGRPDLLSVAGLVVAGAHLVLSARPGRFVPARAAEVVGKVLFWLVVGLGGLLTIGTVTQFAQDVWVGEWVAFTRPLLFCVLTWPAAMFMVLATEGGSAVKPLPQGTALRLLFDDPSAHRVLERWRSIRPQLTWRRGLAAAGVASLAALTAFNLPLDDALERQMDPWQWVAVVVGAIAVLPGQSRGKSVAWKALERRTGGPLDAEALLTVMDAAFRRGKWSVNRFLLTASAAEPGRLRAALPLLSDLERLLTFIGETIPDQTSTVIKDGMWQLAPSFQMARFHDWAVAFDQERPGFLVKMAGSLRQRNLLGQAVRNAESG